MAGFDEFMDKAGELATKAAEKAKDLASAAAVRTKRVSRVAKLNMDISGQKDTIKKAYRDLGKLYYELHRDAPEPALAPLCQQIDTAKAAAAAMEDEIAAIRQEAAGSDEAQDADFASVVDQTADDAGVEVEITVEEPAAPETPEAPAGDAPHDEEGPRWE